MDGIIEKLIAHRIYLKMYDNSFGSIQASNNTQEAYMQLSSDGKKFDIYIKRPKYVPAYKNLIKTEEKADQTYDTQLVMKRH